MPLDVDAVSFDLDDTLCAYERSVEEMLAYSFDAASVEPFFDGARYRQAFDEYVEDFDDVAALREHCFVEIAKERGVDPSLARRVADAYEADRDGANVGAIPGAREVVERLSADYPVGVITNGKERLQRRKLERIGLADAFDVVVYAGDDIPAKPDPTPFERALEALDADPSRTLHVGNSLGSDVTGAVGLGLRSVWTPSSWDLPDGVEDPADLTVGHPGVDPTPDHVLTGVSDLPSLLGGSV